LIIRIRDQRFHIVAAGMEVMDFSIIAAEVPGVGKDDNIRSALAMEILAQNVHPGPETRSKADCRIERRDRATEKPRMHEEGMRL
jgi:hypothetical protein